MDFSTITTYAYDLRRKNSERDATLTAMTNMYMLQWEEADELQRQFAHMRVTLDPSARNKVKAATRLLTTTSATPKVSPELQPSIGEDIANNIERLADVILRQSGRLRNKPVLNDLVLSCILYDEFCATINSTAAIAQMEEGSPARKERNRRALSLTPFIVDIHNPVGCYYDVDALGMTAFSRVVYMSKSEIIGKWGDDGRAALDSKRKDDATNVLDKYKVWTMWTLDWYTCWIEGHDKPIRHKAHQMRVIPAVAGVVEGSSALFDSEKDKREPFLLTIYKSGLWNRSNMLLSATATTASFALWPQIKFTSQLRKSPDIDMTVPFGVFHLEPGEDMQTWNKNLIDPGLQQTYDMVKALVTDSTLYDQVAGASLGPNATYSATALLNQAGRLPLVGTQRQSGWGLGDIMRVAMLLYKDEGARPGASYSEIVDPASIPDNLELEYNVDIALPQDRLGQSGVFQALAGKVSTKWLLEQVLNISDPDKQIRDVMSEQAMMQQFGLYLQGKAMEWQQGMQMQQAAMQQEQAAMQQQMQQAQQPPPGQPPPDQQAMAQQDQAMMQQAAMQQAMAQQGGPPMPPTDEVML